MLLIGETTRKTRRGSGLRRDQDAPTRNVRRPTGACGAWCGEGTYKWVDGASYSGNWQGSKMHGKGQYTDPESVKWEGEFFNGKFFNGKAYVSLR